ESKYPGGEIRLWDAATGKPLCKAWSFDGYVFSVAFRPDGKAFLVQYRPLHRGWIETQQWDTARLQHIGQPLALPGDLPGHLEGTVHAAYSADGKTILTKRADACQLWDAATGSPLGDPIQSNRGAIALSPDGKRFLAAGRDGLVRLCRVGGYRSTLERSLPAGKDFGGKYSGRSLGDDFALYSP